VAINLDDGELFFEIRIWEGKGINDGTTCHWNVNPKIHWLQLNYRESPPPTALPGSGHGLS
jgi:hypothetical protein